MRCSTLPRTRVDGCHGQTALFSARLPTSRRAWRPLMHGVQLCLAARAGPRLSCEWVKPGVEKCKPPGNVLEFLRVYKNTGNSKQ